MKFSVRTIGMRKHQIQRRNQSDIYRRVGNNREIENRLRGMTARVQISNAKARKYLFYSPLTEKKPFAYANGSDCRRKAFTPRQKLECERFSVRKRRCFDKIVKGKPQVRLEKSISSSILQVFSNSCTQK